MQRLNTKFLIVISAFIAIAVGGVAIVYVYNMVKDPARNIQQGRELERIGDFRGASKAYGRAVSKRRSNIEYMDLMRAATLKIVPETAEEARQHYETVMSLLRQRARPNPSDPGPWRELLDAVEARAFLLQAGPAWRALYDTARDMEAAVPAGSEAERIAQATAAFAMAQGNLDLVAADKERTEGALRRVLEQDPKNAKAWDALLLIVLADANALLASNQQVSGQQRAAAFREALAQAEAAIPDSHVPALARSRDVRMRLGRREIQLPQARTELEPLLDKLEIAAMADDAEASTVLLVSDLFLSLGDQAETLRAVAILEKWISRHPDDVVMKRMMAVTLQGMDPDRAMVLLESILNSPPRTVSLEAAFRDEIRADAAERIFDIEVARADRAEDPAQRAKYIEAAKAMRARMGEILRGRPDEPSLFRADARLAMLANDFITVNAMLDKVIAVSRSPGADVFLLAADAAIRRNEMGLALNYVNRGIEAVGASYPLLIARARLEMGLRRGADAAKTANLILSARPDDEQALRILKDAQALSEALSLKESSDPLVKALLDVERKLAEREFEQARRAVQEIMRKNPADSRILGQAARVELALGEYDQAIALLDQALALAPNDSYLRQLRAVVERGDPLDRIEKLAELTTEDPAQRKVLKFVLATSMITSLRRDLAVGGRSSDGVPRDIDNMRTTIATLEAALPELREAANAAAPGDTTVLGALFDEATQAGDFDRAFQIGLDAEQAGKPMHGAFLQARARTYQRRFDEAVQILTRAQQKGIQSAELSRQMGETREAMGMIPEAVAAYKDAFERRPSDRALLERYTDVLRRAGDVQRVLGVYRDAAATGTGDRGIINTWLRMEDLYGDRSLALCWRRKYYRDLPGDRENALALASMLSDGRIDPRLLIEDDCKPKYPEAEWAALPAPQKQAETSAMLKANLVEANDIFRRLFQNSPNDFEVALVQAGSLARTGRLKDGVALLRTIIDRSEEKRRGPMLLALGRYYEENDMPAEAQQAFAETTKYQDPVTREAELALSDYWFERGEWQRSYDALKSVMEAQGGTVDARKHRRMAEICTRLRRFDEARKALDLAAPKAGGAIEPQYELLLGNLELGLAEDAWANGDREGAERHFVAADVAMRRVADAMPGNALPWLSLAGLNRERFLRTKDSKLIDQALEYADRAVSIAGGYWPGVRLKSEILLDRDDMSASIQTIERYLQLAPDSIEGRRLLAERYLRSGNLTRALAVLGEGAALSPRDTIWTRAIGELQLARGNFPDAVRAFDRALEISPNVMNLNKALEARVRSRPPDWTGIVEVARKYPDEMRRSGASQAVLAAALVQTGDRESGLESLRRAGRFVRSEIASGQGSVSDLDIWFHSAREVFPRGRTDDLDTFVNELIAGNPSPDDLRWLATIWLELGKDGLPKAKAYLAKALEHVDARDARYRAAVYLTQGNIAYLDDDCSAAVDAFERSVKEEAEDATALNNLAFLLAKCRNDYQRGLEMAERAVRINPSNAFFLDTLGYLQLKTGNAESAVATLTRCVGMKPSAGAYLHLAQALHATGKIPEARAAVDKAVELKPDAETTAEIEEFRSKLG